MAVCVSADSPYADVNNQFGYGDSDYEGAIVPVADAASNVNGVNGNGAVVEAGLWPNGDIQFPLWQDCEQPDFNACNGGSMLNGVELGQGGAQEWPGGQGAWIAPGANGVGPWRNGMPGRQNGSAGRSKRRFCTSYPDIGLCRRGPQCAFAHSREEISAPLLDVEEERQEQHALTDSFFMFKYKTRWCPIGVQHEWHTCVYAHNYQDARRPVSIGYGARLCPYWSKKDTSAEYSQRCPLGLRCPYSHGAKEQLYHPHYFKTVICRDLRGKACPRQRLCAFFHSRTEKRNPPLDDVDYTNPIDTEVLPEPWVHEFLSPPFLPEVSRGGMEDGNGVGVGGGGPEHHGGGGGGHPGPNVALVPGPVNGQGQLGVGGPANQQQLTLPVNLQQLQKQVDCNGCTNGGGSITPVYAPQSPINQDQFGPCPQGQQPMVFLMPMHMGHPMMQPAGAMMCPQSPQGGGGSWVLVPIEGGSPHPQSPS